MKEKLIQILLLLILVPTFSTSNAEVQINCADYAFKSRAQFYTNSILSCGFQGVHWSESFDEHLKLCENVTPLAIEKIFRKRAQLIFNCLDEQNSSLSKAELEALGYDLNDDLKKSISKHDKKRFIHLLAAGANLKIRFDVNYYGDDYLFYSISQGAVDIVKLLLDQGVTPNRFFTSNKILFHTVIDSTVYNFLDNHQLLELFFKRDLDANLLLPHKKLHASFLALALSEAVNDGDIKTTHALLKKGANPNFIDVKTYDDLHRTPLIRAINRLGFSPVNTSYELVKELLDFGAYPNLLPNGKGLCDELLNRKAIVAVGNPLSHAEVRAMIPKLYKADPEEAKKITRLLKKSGAISLYACEEKRDLLIAEVAVKHNGMALKYTDNEIKKNKKIVLAAVKKNGLALEFAAKSLQKDRAIVMAALKNKGKAFQFIDESLKQDKAVILQAVMNNGRAIFDVDNKLLDKTIVLAAVKNVGYIIVSMDKKYQDDNDIVTAAGIENQYAINDFKNQPINNKKDMLALLKNGNLLKLANDKLRDDKDLVLAAISVNAWNIVYASKRLKNDKEVILELISMDGDTLEYVSNRLKKDKQVVLEAIKQNPSALKFADDILKKDHEIVLFAVTKKGASIEYADDSLKKDKQIVMAAIKDDGAALKYVDLRYQKDKEIVMLAVKNSAYALNYADKALKADREVVLEAVRHSGYALQYAEEILRKDKDIVITAIKDDSSAIKHAHKSLYKNKAFVLELSKIIWPPFALDPSLKNDPYIALQAVKNNGLQLKNLSEKLQADKTIVQLAVENNGLALQFADEKLQRDPQLVSAAIKQNILALKYAGEPVRQNRQWILDFIKESRSLPKWINKELKQDKSFIQAILDQKITTLIYANPKLLKDKALLLAAVKIDGMALRYADNSLKKDREVVLVAVKQEAEAFQYADKQLLENKNVVLDAIKLNGRAYYYASKELQSDKDVILAALHQKINVLKLLTKQPESKPWLTSDAGYSIQRIDLEKPLVLKNLAKVTNGNFVFSPNGLLFAAATELSTGRAQIKIWSTENGKLLYSTVVKQLPYYSYQGLVFSPDSKRLINIAEGEDYGFIWNFHQGDEPFSCGTGTELKEISSQTHSMLTNPADAPLSLYSLKNCDELDYSPEYITTSPYVISPDNQMIIRDNVFINNEKYEQILVEWDNEKNELVLINHNYINNENYWKKSFSDSEEPLGSVSYYPDYKSRKLFYLDKKYIWIINIDTGELINKFPLPKNSIITKLTSNDFSYSFQQPFVISNDNKIMVIDGGEKNEGLVELISLETGKILHSIDVFADNTHQINIPSPAPEGIRDYCPDNCWVCLFKLKTSVSPNGQFIQYGKKYSSSVLIDSLNGKQILKLPALIRSNMSESATGETMFVSMQRANIMSLWKVKALLIKNAKSLDSNINKGVNHKQ